MSSGEIELHPQIAGLQGEIAVLREELVARLAELRELEQVVKPNLLALYQTRLGPWELNLLRARTEVARLKRKIQLIQAALNRGAAPDLAAIDGALETEFLAWQQRLAEAAQQIEQAQFRLSHLVSAEENAELKKVFHALAKKLHPDVNPELSSAQRELWLQVLAAYEAADLQKLKALSLVAQEPLSAAAAVTSLDLLQREHERLQAHIKRLHAQVAEIGTQPPFSLQRQWQDDAWIERRRAEVEAETAGWREQAGGLENHLKALLILHGSKQQFGLN
jgi:hypothetical protein